MSRVAVRRVGWPLVAVLAFLLAWSLSTHRVPLYDGVGFPDEPYRYIHPPAGYQTTKPAGVGIATSGVAGGTNSDALYANSPEQGPQVSVFIPPHEVQARGAGRLTLRAAPLAPDAEPTGGRIDGNVYRLTVTTAPAGGTVQLRLGTTAIGGTAGSAGIVLRATSGRQPGPSFVYRPDAGTLWSVLATARVGNDIYRTPLAGLGDYALAWGVRPADAAQHTSGTGTLPWILVAVLVLALVVLVVSIRISRSRRT